MKARQFDALVLSLLPSGSRRSVLTGLVGAASFGVWRGSASAACHRVRAKCGHGAKCCPGSRCRNGKCRCKAGWTTCNGENFCRDLASDPNHCGACNQACQTGCCAGGACRDLCQGQCCANCFAEADGSPPVPDLTTAACCDDAAVCDSNTDDPSDDRCCFPNEVCLDGSCCCDCLGTKPCGGVCCPSVACCNNKCCGPGQVCARPNPNGPSKCVSADRTCTANGDCFPGEECWGGICCSGDRLCFVQGQGTDPVCCPLGMHCDLQLQSCCANGVICTTSKKVRIRV